jgi:hypothetical protein
VLRAIKNYIMNAKKFKVKDRVRRVGGSGCSGVVTDVRIETTISAAEADKEKNLMIQVLWDNGTQSFFGPDGLEPAKD